MLSLTQFKALLGPLAEHLTDEKITVLMNAEYQLADAFIEQWRKKRQNYQQQTEVNKITDEYNESNDSDSGQKNYDNREK